MIRALRIRSPRGLLFLFLATGALLVFSLAWLGWQLARQDREVAAQRMQEERESAADWTVSALKRSLSEVSEHLRDLAASPASRLGADATRLGASLPEDSALLVFGGGCFDAYPAGRLPYYPETTPFTPPTNPALERATDLELRLADFAGASGLLERAAREPDPWVRATARLHLARIAAKRGAYTRALAAYDHVAESGDAPVEMQGLPATLVASQQRLAILARRPDREGARRDADTILEGLRQRRWRLTRGQYEYFANEALRALGRSGLPPETPAALALASIAERLQSAGDTRADREGTVVWEGRTPLFVLAQSKPERRIVLLLGADWVQRQLAAAPRSVASDRRIAITVSDSNGAVVFGRASVEARLQTVRLGAATRLPWNLHAVSIDAGAAYASSNRRRQLLVTGLGTITILVLVGIALIGRAVSREFAASRMQSDFVSAVSHEFRTPLSSLCHLSEMLQAGRVAGEHDRDEYYAVLVRESRRLRRLVEGLLNFGRMEAGAMQYRFETVDPVEVVRDVVAEFERDVRPRGYRVQTVLDNDTPLVRADSAALACALWNLLDNAVKYSPDCRTVWVEASRRERSAVVQVRDEGIGIQMGEHERIFEKFVRGRAAADARIVGTGVGLALVRHIASAHGGRVTVKSAPGRGSTFTLELPSCLAS